MTQINDVVIIGSGPAGLTAAIYAARAALNPVVYTGIQPGGQLTTTTEIENFPGFQESVTGAALMEQMSAQAIRFGTKIFSESVDKVDFSDKIKKLYINNDEIFAKTVIIATGATAKTLGLPNETNLYGKGLSTCATCDGFFYKNKSVAIVGGGDSAMEEAIFLANIVKEVKLLHRRDFFRASKIMLDRARSHPKIRFMVPYRIEATTFDNMGLNGIEARNLETDKTEKIDIDGLFYAIGHTPNSKLFADFVELDENGYIKVLETQTKTPGVFAAGDVADPFYKQAVTAAAMGCQAAIRAGHYLTENF